MGERILVKVHTKAVERWAGQPKLSYSGTASELLSKIKEAEADYDHIVKVEGDLWEPEWSPRDHTFSWEPICDQLDKDDSIDISGAQRGLCVSKVDKELKKRGFQTNVRDDLTMDLED